MNANLTAERDVLEEIYTNLANFINTLDNDTVSWQAPVQDANSIAVLVRHTIGSTDSWLTRAVGDPVVRDRDAEFRYMGTISELVELLDGGLARAKVFFERLDAVDPGKTVRYKRITATDEEDYSVAWCIEHALVHAAEHWGHIQLTAQLYAAKN